jgi:hypothetical protein
MWCESKTSESSNYLLLNSFSLGLCYKTFSFGNYRPECLKKLPNCLKSSQNCCQILYNKALSCKFETYVWNLKYPQQAM